MVEVDKTAGWMGDTAKDDSSVEGYEVVVHYGTRSIVYEAEHNVCEFCGCGFTNSGGGHVVGCLQRKTCEKPDRICISGLV